MAQRYDSSRDNEERAARIREIVEEYVCCHAAGEHALTHSSSAGRLRNALIFRSRTT
jgi:hypothetical protein